MVQVKVVITMAFSGWKSHEFSAPQVPFAQAAAAGYKENLSLDLSPPLEMLLVLFKLVQQLIHTQLNLTSHDTVHNANFEGK